MFLAQTGRSGGRGANRGGVQKAADVGEAVVAGGATEEEVEIVEVQGEVMERVTGSGCSVSSLLLLFAAGLCSFFLSSSSSSPSSSSSSSFVSASGNEPSHDASHRSVNTNKLFKANTHLSAKGPTEDRVTYLAGDCRRPPSGPGLC